MASHINSLRPVFFKCITNRLFGEQVFCLKKNEGLLTQPLYNYGFGLN